MNTKNKILILITALLFAATPMTALGERSQSFEEHVVHYNAFITDTLQPEIAKAYRIKRSKNRAMLNIVVQKKIMGTTGQPIPAKITGTATNLTGQVRTLEIREIRDGNAIYYISDFRITNQETLDFKLVVTPKDGRKILTIKFRQQFFTG